MVLGVGIWRRIGGGAAGLICTLFLRSVLLFDLMVYDRGPVSAITLPYCHGSVLRLGGGFA